MKRFMVVVALAIFLSVSIALALECPSGKVLAGGMATSGCIYELQCLTPEKKAEADTWFSQCWCEEMGVAWIDIGKVFQFSYSRSSRWIDGHCVSIEEWKKYDGIHWITLTKEEYEKELAREDVDKNKN